MKNFKHFKRSLARKPFCSSTPNSAIQVNEHSRDSWSMAADDTQITRNPLTCSGMTCISPMHIVNATSVDSSANDMLIIILPGSGLLNVVDEQKIVMPIISATKEKQHIPHSMCIRVTVRYNSSPSDKPLKSLSISLGES